MPEKTKHSEDGVDACAQRALWLSIRASSPGELELNQRPCDANQRRGWPSPVRFAGDVLSS
ncbi:MAG TPA: hypothetical protein VK524_08665 [Polyangiaceae bacterium]|nr:hypothetical protein [Polyangiaceae bacterium]